MAGIALPSDALCLAAPISVHRCSSFSPYGNVSNLSNALCARQWPLHSHRQRRLVPRAVADGPVPVARRINKVKETKEVLMVDPVEAKRLAAAEMDSIRAKNKLKKQRRIEAINGGFAVIGLTCGLILEALTGKSILQQVAGYLSGSSEVLFKGEELVLPQAWQEIASQVSSAQETVLKALFSS